MGNDDTDASRTDLAEDRTVLANERTFAGWMRTSMACVAVAVGMPALFREFEPNWVLKVAGTILIVAAIFLILLAWRRAQHVLSRLSTHTIDSMPSTPIGAISAGLIVAYMIFGLALWFL